MPKSASLRSVICTLGHKRNGCHNFSPIRFQSATLSLAAAERLKSHHHLTSAAAVRHAVSQTRIVFLPTHFPSQVS
jgi:hypothetical protein